MADKVANKSQSSDIHHGSIDASPDLRTRDKTVIAYPTDKDDADGIEGMGIDLEAAYGNRVAQNQDGEGKLHWLITLDNEDDAAKTADNLRRYDGLTVPDEGNPPKFKKLMRRCEDPTSTDTLDYIAAPKQDNTDEDNANVREFLESKVTDKKRINEIKIDGKIRLWGGLSLTPDAKSEVEQHDRIQGPLGEDRKLAPFRALPRQFRSEFVRDVYDKFDAITSHVKRTIVKRAITWTRQRRAFTDLVEDSAPKEGVNRPRDFVYDSKAGEGIYIYVIDEGVAVDVKGKDPTDVPELNIDLKDIIQTDASIAAGQKKNEDDSVPNEDDPDPFKRQIGSHGTMVACKAGGKLFGLAKKANIVPVKMIMTTTDMIAAMAKVLTDIEEKDRGKKSVVVLSMGVPTPTTRDEVLKDPVRSEILKSIEGIMKLGAPVVFASGNFRTAEPNKPVERDNIDAYPQVLEEKQDTPIINVGAARAGGGATRGDRAYFSQGGDQLSVYAPGVSAWSYKKDGEKGVFHGTSIAAPAVGGLIATYLSMNEQPEEFREKTGLDRVIAIRDYLISEKSSYERKEQDPPVRMIWNGVDKEAYQNAKEPCKVGSKKRKRQNRDDLEEVGPNEPGDCGEEAPSTPTGTEASQTKATNQPSSTAPPDNPPPDDPPPDDPPPDNPPPDNPPPDNPPPDDPPPDDPPPDNPPPANPPPDKPNTAECQVLEEGFGFGTWEIKGSGWGNEASLKENFGDDDFEFSGGDPWTATFNSEESEDDIEATIEEMSGLSDVSCSG